MHMSKQMHAAAFETVFFTLILTESLIRSWVFVKLRKVKEVKKPCFVMITFLKFQQDVQWNDIEYASDNKIFTYNNSSFSNLPEFVQDLHNNGQHYIQIVVSTCTCND